MKFFVLELQTSRSTFHDIDYHEMSLLVAAHSHSSRLQMTIVWRVEREIQNLMHKMLLQRVFFVCTYICCVHWVFSYTQNVYMLAHFDLVWTFRLQTKCTFVVTVICQIFVELCVRVACKFISKEGLKFHAFVSFGLVFLIGYTDGSVPWCKKFDINWVWIWLWFWENVDLEV